MATKQIYLDCIIDEVEAAPEYDQVKVPMEAVVSGLVEDEDNCAKVIKEVLKRMRDDEHELAEMLVILLKNFIDLGSLDEDEEGIFKLALKVAKRFKNSARW